MSQHALPEDVQELVRRYIHSVAQLEALLLICRSPDQRWHVEQLARALYTSAADVADALTSLTRDGFLQTQQGTYTLASSPARRAQVEALSKAYSSHLIAITNVIHSKPKHIQAFSDAFRIRKD
jgi:DNA-binding MarR family transcriptional regulator